VEGQEFRMLQRLCFAGVAVLLLATDAVPIVKSRDEPVYPPGNITVKMTIDSNTICNSRPLYVQAEERYLSLLCCSTIQRESFVMPAGISGAWQV
jgi:hypothetical protein